MRIARTRSRMSARPENMMTTMPAPLALATDLLTGWEWNPARVRELFQLTADIKARPNHYANALTGRFIALILEKPSLRTRVTFQVGIQSMGGRLYCWTIRCRGSENASRFPTWRETFALGAWHSRSRVRAKRTEWLG